MKTIYCIMGRTASGKDTFVQKACANFAFKQLISYTDRPPRSADEKTHVFATTDDLNQHRANNWVIAETEINGFHYWALESQLEDRILYVIDYRGLQELRRTIGDRYHIVPIYICADAAVRKQRFMQRGAAENEHLFDNRNASEDEQFSELEEKQDYDYLVDNSSEDWPTAFIRFWNCICGKIKSKE